MKRIFVAWLRPDGVRGSVSDRRRSAALSAGPRRSYNPIYNWTGFYIGINGGGGWGESQWDGLNKFDLSGGMIGGTIGYNWQAGQIVVGAEGDIDWSGVKGTTTALCAAGCETRNKWLATVPRPSRLRVRSVPALHHRWSGGRGHQCDRPGFPGGQRQQRGLDDRRRARVWRRQQCEHQSEYLYVEPRRLQLRLQLRSRGNGNVSYNANLFRGGLNVRF